MRITDILLGITAYYSDAGYSYRMNLRIKKNISVYSYIDNSLAGSRIGKATEIEKRKGKSTVIEVKKKIGLDWIG